MNQTRIHVRFDDQRSTVSVDTVLFELMALQLGHNPDEAGALPAVREWLQECATVEGRDQGRPVEKGKSGGARAPGRSDSG